ncbi:MAG: Chemotaxis protein CheY [Firmicutes bacterium]|nr:Chemotaxis protein CheY [candidate division NPL-UPA2 bacterium]
MQYRFFVVDDDIAVRRMLQEVIQDSGLGVLAGSASCGHDARQALLSAAADIVLVDLLLPDMDGIELVRLLSASLTASFVMISQVQAKVMVEAAYDAGIDFFIHKPINSREVRAVLAKVCETLALKRTVSSIYRSMAELSVSTAPPTATSSDKTRLRTRAILRDLGIGGESGARDLEEAAVFIACGHTRDTVSVKDLLLHVAGDSLTAQKAAEQRMRRAVQSALRHLAALGLEDYAHPRFENYAATFFDFAEVRLEMRHVEHNAPYGGKMSLKRFINALAHEAVER